jgi:acyl carrier protein phosphodiesterase
VNYLCHLYLSGPDPEILTGNFMGDFVKGPLGGAYPPSVRRGIELHRRIDSFARDQADFNRSRLRIAPEFGLYRGVLVDLFYDHFLARDWQRWSPNQPLQEFLTQARAVIEARRDQLPQRLEPIVPVIFDELLPSYAEPGGITRALERMSRRVRRANPLEQGGAELLRGYSELEKDFGAFLPAAQHFVTQFLTEA